jgi:hypothetical protein
MVRAPVVRLAHTFNTAQGQRPGKLKLPGRKILLLARVILIKAPPFYLIIEMIAVKQFSGAANVVATLLKELRQ